MASKEKTKKTAVRKSNDDTALEDAPYVDPDPTDEFDLKAFGTAQIKERMQNLKGVLTVRRSVGNEVEIPIDDREITIGRDNSCDIVLHDESVSRRHAAVSRTEAGYFELKDLGSRNGTLVDGLPVKEMLITAGDKFTVGKVRLTFTVSQNTPS